MINPTSEIRKGLYALLNNAVTYSAANVPVYEGEGVVAPYQILIGETSYTDQSDKHSFTGRVNQIIEVVTEKSETASIHADTIMNSVLNLLFPTPRTTGLSVTGFQVIGMKKNIQATLREDAGNGNKIIRKILELNFLINQVNL